MASKSTEPWSVKSSMSFCGSLADLLWLPMTNKKIKCGYLGPQGTFTEELAQQVFVGDEYESIAYPSNRNVLRAVAQGELDEGIVPIENSIEGTVNEVTDTILQLTDLWITAEIIQPIKHHLVGLRNVSLQKAKTILSHPQAYGQCQRWLAEHLPDATFEVVSSTAKAVQILGTGQYDETHVAIGNRRAADVNEHTQILAESIQDSEDNVTRFVKVSRSEPDKYDGPHKTSIVFSTARDVPGSLLDALNVLKVFRINMTKIESRPAKKAMGDYFFLIDFMGHHTDDSVTRALDLLTEWVTDFRRLGSYPRLTFEPTPND